MHFCANTRQYGLKALQSSTFIHFWKDPTEYTSGPDRVLMNIYETQNGKGTWIWLLLPLRTSNLERAFFGFRHFTNLFLFCFRHQSNALDFIRYIFYFKKYLIHRFNQCMHWKKKSVLSALINTLIGIRNVWKVLDNEFFSPMKIMKSCSN